MFVVGVFFEQFEEAIHSVAGAVVRQDAPERNQAAVMLLGLGAVRHFDWIRHFDQAPLDQARDFAGQVYSCVVYG